MRKNPEKMVRDILATSLQLFQEVGYDKTSILDIVEAMGVTRGAFYHHLHCVSNAISLIQGFCACRISYHTFHAIMEYVTSQKATCTN